MNRGYQGPRYRDHFQGGAMADSRFRDLRAAKEELSARFLRPSNITTVRALKTPVSPVPTRNVVGVGLGYKLVDGKTTGIPSIKILVRLKLPAREIGSQHLLPATFAG